MTFATLFAELPVWAIVVGVAVVLVVLCRYRIAVACAMTAFAAFGLWRTDPANIWIAIPFGLFILVVLSAVSSLFGGSGDFDGDDAKGYDYDAEQQRIANEYHRRQREGRF